MPQATAKQFFKVNQEIISLQADKGNKTVIMYKNEYISKMDILVGDTNPYTELRKEPTTNMQNKNNRLVKSWLAKGYIAEEEKKYLTTYTSLTPRIYCLPKIQKSGYLLRRIASCINSPTYHLSKFLSNILRKSIDQEKYNINNSFSFKEFITEQTIPPNYILVSLDVINNGGIIVNLENKDTQKLKSDIEEKMGMEYEIKIPKMNA